MTDKRFTEIISIQKVIDNKTGKEYDCLIDDDLLKLLNELHEENRGLQRHLDVMRSGALTDDKRIKELYDENKQLKQENRKLKEDLEHCANQFTNDGKNVLLSLR